MTFSNITQQKQAQGQIPRLQYIVERSPLLVLTLDAQGKVAYANPLLYALTRLNEQDVVGHPLQELLAEQDDAATDTLATAWQQVQAGQEWQGEWVFQGKTGERLPLLAHLLPIPGRQEDGTTALLFAQDQREQRRQATMIQRFAQLLRMVGNGYQMLISGEDEQTLLTMMCRSLVDTAGYLSAWVGVLEDSSTLQVRPVAHAGYKEGFLETLNLVWAENQETHMPASTVIRTGQPVVLQYIQSDPTLANWRELAQTRGYNAMITLALHYQGRVFGILHIQATEPDAFDAQMMEVLQTVADNIAYGMSVLREG
jgi:PAS domain S-box-containing protein